MTIQNLSGRLLVLSFAISSTILFAGAEGPNVTLAPMDAVGPRPLERQTQKSVIRDYLQAWRGMAVAFEKNNPDSLDADFVGAAKKKLADAIHDQARINVQTSYRDKSHNIKIVFYSPEGLSIELTDDVEYQVEVHDGRAAIGVQDVYSRYTAVLTPTESTWKVRILQGGGTR
jgi:hypothetical protein